MLLVRFQADQYNRLKNDTSKAVGEKKKVKFNRHFCFCFVCFILACFIYVIVIL